MKPLLFGAVLALVWLILGLPVTAPVAVLPWLVQPLVVAFAAGLLARPYLARTRRWSA